MWPLVVTGLLGSFHCVGMCGGFVLSIDRPGRMPWRRIGAQALFHLGKGVTYVILGGVAGLAGAALVHAAWFGAAQAVLAVVAGVLMVLAGLQLMGRLKDLPLGRLFGPGSPYARAMHSVVNLRGPLAPFLLGSLTGILPCPLVYAFLAAAAATGSVLGAMGTMALLALCSLPALALVATTGAALAPTFRVRFVRVAGVVVLLLGVVTVARGLAPDWFHGPHA
jgi:sulfite exporter TauE/SafE